MKRDKITEILLNQFIDKSYPAT